MVQHDTIDRTEAAGDLESVEQIRLAADGNFDALRSRRFYVCAERKPLGAMAHEIEKAVGSKSPKKDESFGLRHDALTRTVASN
jgi:hypothetical protein